MLTGRDVGIPDGVASSLRFAVVDDELINSGGLEAGLVKYIGAEVKFCGDFEEARGFDFRQVDYVICDMANPKIEVMNYPAIALIREIKNLPSAPIVIAVTGYKDVFNEQVLRGILVELGADFFVWRPHLNDLLKEVKYRAKDSEEFLAALPVAATDESIDDLGLVKRSSRLRLLDYLEGYHDLLTKGKIRRTDEWLARTARAGAQGAAGRLEARSTDGAPQQGLPHFATLRSFYERATRLPEKYR